MIEHLQLPDRNIDVKKLYLFDTNIVIEIFSDNEKPVKGDDNKYRPHQIRIAHKILDGTINNGCITTAVMDELPGAIKSRCGIDYDVINAKIENFRHNHTAMLYNVHTPYEEHVKLNDVYNYLQRAMSYKSRGELSVLMASLVSGIPMIVSDDGELFRNDIRGYLTNRFRERFPRVYTKNFDILDSKTFCIGKKI